MAPAIHFPCDGCGSGVNAASDAVSASCRACRKETSLAPDGAVRTGGPVARCAVCARDRFYVQKDFNRRLGLWLVLASAAASFVVYAWWGYWAIVFLGVVTLADALLYRALPMVSVCYGCGAIYRGFAANPDHQPFDLHLAEVYEKKTGHSA